MPCREVYFVYSFLMLSSYMKCLFPSLTFKFLSLCLKCLSSINIITGSCIFVKTDSIWFLIRVLNPFTFTANIDVLKPTILLFVFYTFHQFLVTIFLIFYLLLGNLHLKNALGIKINILNLFIHDRAPWVNQLVHKTNNSACIKIGKEKAEVEKHWGSVMASQMVQKTRRV